MVVTASRFNSSFCVQNLFSHRRLHGPKEAEKHKMRGETSIMAIRNKQKIIFNHWAARRAQYLQILDKLIGTIVTTPSGN